jgi:hypothetical protein
MQVLMFSLLSISLHKSAHILHKGYPHNVLPLLLPSQTKRKYFLILGKGFHVRNISSTLGTKLFPLY